MEVLSIDQAIQQRMDEIIASYLEGACALDPKPSRVVSLVPGTSVVWDECCDGQLTVRLVNMAPKIKAGPVQSLPCSIEYWIATFEVMILRCAATVDNRGISPSPQRLAQDGTQGLRDMNKVTAGLFANSKVKSIGNWQPQGPQGGCFGGSITFTMWFSGPKCE